MRDHHQRAAIARQPVFQPRDGLRVDVVGRLVQQQQIDRTDQRCGQRHTLLLPAGERAHIALKIRDAQLREQRPRLVFVRRADVLRRVAEHLLHAGALRVIDGHLRQVGHAQAVSAHHHAPVRLLHAAQQLEQRRFARAVHADHADAVMLADVERRVGDQLLERVALFNVLSGKDRRHISSAPPSPPSRPFLPALPAPPAQHPRRRWPPLRPAR